jgi:hypothetical protein
MGEDDRQLELLPEELIAGLKRIDRTQAIVDPRTDRAVLAQAEQYFASRTERRATAGPKRWAIPVAFAAMIAVALVIAPLAQRTLFGDPDDVDGSGRVDILDAFALARQEQSAEAGAERVEEIVERIVSLSASRPQP